MALFCLVKFRCVHPTNQFLFYFSYNHSKPMSTLPYYPIRHTNRPSSNGLDRLILSLLISLVIFLAAVPVTLILFEISYGGRIMPGISISGVNVSGLKPADAAGKIAQAYNDSQNGKILLKDGDKTWAFTPGELGFFIDPEASAMAAYQVGRQGDITAALTAQFHSWWSGTDLPPVAVYKQRITQQVLLDLSKQTDQPIIEATLGLNGAEVAVKSGQVGRSLDIAGSTALIGVQLHSLQSGVIPLLIRQTPPLVMDASQQADIARSILSAPLTLSLPQGQAGGGPWVIKPAVLANMLTIEQVKNSSGAQYQVGINSDILRVYLNGLAPSLAQTPQNARFTFNDTTHQLEVLQHSVTGRSLDVDATIQSINQKLASGDHNIALVLKLIQPAAPDTATADQLGIHELIQSQTSYFRGSSPERIQNITTAAGRFHGLLIAPGETFSMANALGDISLDNGYAEALIILGNQTIQGVGGGVCQVSTTLFRTAFFAGFPINERHPHAYRVGYYEQKAGSGIDAQLAGLDATVFVPLVDFKFTNNTPNWLLMETYINDTSLTWKFYSTSDGRKVSWKTTGPTNVVKAPDPLYKEDSTLAKGVIKQTDYSADGADITVTRTVTLNGKSQQDVFSTHYEPWRAVFNYGPGTDGIPTPSTTSTP